MSASVPAVELPVPADPLQIRPIAWLTLGHGLVDLCQGLVPALVAYLVTREDYSYAASAGLVFATSALSSVVQPLFGQWADKGTVPHLLPISVLLAGCAFAIGTQTQFYPVLLLACAASGLGIAAFHPEAARRTFLAAGPRRTTAMSYFSLGGSIGFAVAPMLGTLLLTNFGRRGVLWVIPLAVAVAIPLAWEFSRPAAPRVRSAAPPQGADNWTGFWILSVAVIARSIVFFGINTFLALHWRQHWNVELTGGTFAASTFLMCGVIGTLLGGWCGDRLGRRAVIQMGFGLSTLLFPCVFLAPDPRVGLVLLGLLAAMFFAPSSPSVVLGQEYLPHRVGVASGVTIGLAVSTGGMVTPLLGRLGDVAGLQTVFVVLNGLLAVCFLSTCLLPAIPPAKPNSTTSGPPPDQRA